MGKAMATDKTMLELKDVYRHFRQGDGKVEVLRGASLTIRQGEMVALVGPSGCGKSTLLNVAGLLEKPNKGDVLIEGKSTAALGQRACGRLRRSHIGFVFQFHRLLPEFSALENVMIPQMLNGLARSDAHDRSVQLLEMVGLGNRGDHRPAALSGGEQQRVAIARAVANAPDILLADEPTGNLDPNTATEVFNSIEAIVRATQTAALIVTHNSRLALKMDRALTIREGTVSSF